MTARKVERVVRTSQALAKTDGTRISLIEFDSAETSELFELLVQDVRGHEQLMQLLKQFENELDNPIVPMDY